MRIYILLLIFVAVDAKADAGVWVCGSSRFKTEVMTNTPVSTLDSTCYEKELGASPFNKFSKEQFAALGKSSPEDKERPEGEARSKDSDIAADKVLLTWEAEQVNKTESGQKGSIFDRLCLIEGKASGKKAGQAAVSIVRGALTVDSFRVAIPPDYESVSWAVSLEGNCRYPQLSAHYVD